MASSDSSADDRLAYTLTADGGRDGALQVTELGQGTVLGRYTVLKTLGAGGMGVVYLAYDGDLDRKIALKVLRRSPDGSRDASRGRLLREARAMARLNHPNVITVYEVGTVRDTDFVAMEYIAGPSLSEWLDGERGWREVVDVFRKAGRGLVAAHKAGLVHRDFKPSNVLIETESGRVLVTDFGLAQIATSERDEELAPLLSSEALLDTASPVYTQTGALLGTPAYMAPEQFEFANIDERSDQFSFAASLFEGLYGRRPFAGETLAELKQAVLAGDTGTVAMKRRIPGWLRRTVERGLSTDPLERFPSMEAFLLRLRSKKLAPVKLALAGTVVVAAALTAVVVFRGGTNEGAICEDGATELDAVWPGRMADLNQAFLSSKQDHGGGVTRFLDDYAVQWKTVYRERCQAARVKKAISAADFHLHAECLRVRRTELEGLLSALISSRLGATTAVSAVHNLPSVASCADLAVVKQGIPEPAEATLKAQVTEQRGTLAKARSLEYAAQYERAEQIAKSVLDAGISYKPLEAQARYRLGRIAFRANYAQRSRSYLLESLVLAEESQYRGLRAQIKVALAQHSVLFSSDYALSRRMLREATANVQNLPRTPQQQVLSARLANALGMVELAVRQYELALGHFQRAVELYTALGGQRDFRLASPLQRMAVVSALLGDHKDALQLKKRAHEILREHLGEQHPDTASAGRSVAGSLRMLGQPEEATGYEDQFRQFALSERGRDHASHALGLKLDIETARVRGIIVDGNGKPVADALVVAGPRIWSDGQATHRLMSYESIYHTVTTRSDANGHFDLDGVAVDPQSFVVGDAAERGRTSPVAITKDAESLRLVLLETGRLTGRVRSATGEFSSIFVAVSPHDEPYGSRSQTGYIAVVKPDGSYSIPRIPVGKYRVMTVLTTGEAQREVLVKEAVVRDGGNIVVDFDLTGIGIGLVVKLFPKPGMPLASANVSIIPGHVSASTAEELNRKLHADDWQGKLRGGRAEWSDVRSDSPDSSRHQQIRFPRIKPGKYTLVVAPLPGDTSNPDYIRALAKNRDEDFDIVVKHVELSKDNSLREVAVEIPPMNLDKAVWN